MTSTKELLIKAKAAVKHLRGADSKKIDAALGFMADKLIEKMEKADKEDDEHGVRADDIDLPQDLAS